MTLKRKKTGFDKFFDQQMSNRGFRSGHEKVASEIAVVDALVRALDEARLNLGLSKAELARRVSTKPEIIRRLFTSDDANPTLATFVKLAEAMDYTVKLVPGRKVAKPSKRRSRKAAPWAEQSVP